MHKSVDDFLDHCTSWKKELSLLHEILLSCGLKCSIKWKVPCYTNQKKNIALIHGFTDYFAVAFFKGALLQDAENLLIQQTENVQSARQMRFKSAQELEDLESILKAYLFEAIEVEKQGLKVAYKKVEEYDLPAELTAIFNADLAFSKAFDALTPGRKKGYLLHFSGAKQASTRLNRINKYRARILNGKGINDCICGLSKRMPNCDGSHKQLEKPH